MKSKKEKKLYILRTRLHSWGMNVAFSWFMIKRNTFNLAKMFVKRNSYKISYENVIYYTKRDYTVASVFVQIKGTEFWKIK